MDSSKNRPNDYLGVNKIGKNIRKSPLHQPNFTNNGSVNNTATNNNNIANKPPQPQVYNISKTDFRSLVQQLTGSSSHTNNPTPPPPNNPPKPPSMRLQRIRPPPLSPPQPPAPPMPELSPISAYMQQLQSCIGGTTPRTSQPTLLSPTSQFVLPSPSAFFGLLSPTPRSPFPPPLSPNFAFSALGQPPLSPGSAFPPPSPSFFSMFSPRWRDP